MLELRAEAPEVPREVLGAFSKEGGCAAPVSPEMSEGVSEMSQEEFPDEVFVWLEGSSELFRDIPGEVPRA